MQIWKSLFMSVLIQKQHLELFNRKVCEMFVYKQTETMEYVKK